MDELNNAYIISTYHNYLNIESNKKLHKEIDEYGRSFEIFNTTFPYSVNRTFYIHTYLLNIYIALQFIRNEDFLVIDSPKDTIRYTESQNIDSNVYVIKIENKDFVLKHRTNNTVLVSSLVTTEFDSNGKMIHPFDIRNTSESMSNIDDVYKCNIGNLKKSEVYYMLYLYNKDTLYDYVTLQGYVTAAYTLSLNNHVTIVYYYYYLIYREF